MEFGTIATYLTHRWDEEEAVLERIMSHQGVYRYFKDNGNRLLADITAKRKLLLECENALDRTGREATMGRTILDFLAEPYADRDDFPRRRRS
ncbi:DUF6221 family protein [[Actinomadura] parvosata]|uniref:DUF6221 family protein n=1 Tax=[Actinomadura] parvosata TaxID=1955412 RepID=UPI00406C53E3